MRKKSRWIVAAAAAGLVASSAAMRAEAWTQPPPEAVRYPFTTPVPTGIQGAGNTVECFGATWQNKGLAAGTGGNGAIIWVNPGAVSTWVNAKWLCADPWNTVQGPGRWIENDLWTQQTSPQNHHPCDAYHPQSDPKKVTCRVADLRQ